MTPEQIAALHARCFDDTPRPWSAAAFAGLLREASAVSVLRRDGFAMGRVTGPEAELLTLAVAPEVRRRGLGRDLVAAFEAAAAACGAGEIFLEVAVTNRAARALYASRGYAAVGRRPGYYARPTGPAVDALVLRKALSTPGRSRASGKNQLTRSGA
jgi:ribosomal-protein-alanine N-acetyltransferase